MRFKFLFIFLLLLPLISAEQVVWDNDSDIRIQDNWKDVDGTTLTNANCTWYVYNPSGSINQSGTHTELVPGVFNFTINQLPELQTYPLLFNCTKSGFNGTSTKDSIRIVDEIVEDFKDSIDQINQTTSMTYDLLSNQINDTLNLILSTSNFTKENLTTINSQLDLILTDTNLIVDKWGEEDAEEIIHKIKDLGEQINELKFRIDYVSSDEFKSRVLGIFSTSKDISNKLNDTEDGLSLIAWFWIIFGIILLFLIIAIAASKNK